MSPPKPRLYGLQILRGIAALLVVFHHAAEVAIGLAPNVTMPQSLMNGAFGVDLFFPISGVVMYLTASRLLLRSSPQTSLWPEFGWRRLIRVVPLYWLCTTLKLALFFAVPAAMLHFRLRPANVIASYLFLPTLGPELKPYPVLPVGWTLNYEVFFYLLLTLALAARLPLIRTLAIAIGTLALLGMFLPKAWGAWVWFANPIQLEFLAGLTLGALLPRIQLLPLWLPAVLMPASFIFALQYPLDVWSLSRTLLWGVPGALIVLSVLALEQRLPLHRWRFPLLLGDASYSLYLTHTFVLPAVGLFVAHLPLHGHGRIAVFLTLNTILCLAAGILAHLYVELPLLSALSSRRLPWSTRSAGIA